MNIAKFLFIALAALIAQSVAGQIGYQIAVIDQSTGQAKANANVPVELTISDNSGVQFYSQSESVTTNDLGLATLQIGNESTFSNVDWSKLPLWISATVDGVSMGKTQILTVPVAEHALHTGTLTVEKLLGRWYMIGNSNKGFTFNANGTATRHYSGSTSPYKYYISGDFVILRDIYHYEDSEDSYYGSSHAIFYYSEDDNVLVGVSDTDGMAMIR